jgi:hypothetical protein
MKSLWKYSALLICPLLASPAVASAAAGVITLGTAPNYQTFSDFGQPVALLPDGTYASIWTSWARSLDIQTQWVRPDGSPLLADGGLLVGQADYALASAVVARPAGGAFMAYVGGLTNPADFNPATDHLQVFVQAYDAAGNPLWQAGGVPAMDVAPAHLQQDFQLAAAPGGGVYVCAEEDIFDPTYGRLNLSESDIRCQRLGAGGERLWTDQGVDAGGQPGLKVLPKLLSDGHGGVLAFWSNLRDPFDNPKDPMSIEGQHLTPQGKKTWGSQGRTLRTAGISGAYSLLGNNLLLAASDGQGGAILSFNDWNGRGPVSLDVYAQRVNGAGRVLWGGAAAVATGGTQQQNDSLTATPDGGAFITVWEPNLSGEPVADRLSLYRLGPDGKVLWQRQLSAPEPGMASSDWGAHGSFDGGLLRLAWNHQPQQGVDEAGPRLIVVDLTGHPLNGSSGAPLGTGGGSRLLGGLVYDPARKQGFAVWTENDGGGTDVAGAFFNQ